VAKDQKPRKGKPLNRRVRHEIGQVIRQGRGDQKQDVVAEALGFEKASGLGDYEVGKRIPSLELLHAICENQKISLKREAREKLRRLCVPLGPDEQWLSADDPLVKSLLKATEPPRLKGKQWSQREAMGIFPQIYGVVVSLLQSWSIIERYPHLGAWRRERLFPDLRTSIVDKGYVDWEQSPDLALWALGYFLNKGQDNLAAATDRCITEWFEAKLRQNSNAPSEVDCKLEELLGQPIQDRLDRLGQALPTGMTKNRVTELQRAFVKYKDTALAINCIGGFAEQFGHRFRTGVTAQEAFEAIPSREIGEAECVSVVFRYCGRYRVGETRQRVDASYRYRQDLKAAVEWAITAKGVIWVGEFWKLLLKDTEA
jgi:hypothetical protein